MKKVEKDQKNFNVRYLEQMMELYMKSNRKEKIKFLGDFDYIMSTGEEICKNELEYFRTFMENQKQILFKKKKKEKKQVQNSTIPQENLPEPENVENLEFSSVEGNPQNSAFLSSEAKFINSSPQHLPPPDSNLDEVNL